MDKEGVYHSVSLLLGEIDDRLHDSPTGDLSARCRYTTPKFVYIETQGLLNPARDWDNEIHPTPDGFEKLAVAFQNALMTQFPGLP
jgi:hypothetical protein